MSRGRGEKLRPFCFIQLRPKPLRVNELTEFQELQESHRVEVWSVKFGEITDTKLTQKFASFAVFLRRAREGKEAGAETTAAHYHARLNYFNLDPYRVLATHSGPMPEVRSALSSSAGEWSAGAGELRFRTGGRHVFVASTGNLATFVCRPPD